MLRLDMNPTETRCLAALSKNAVDFLVVGGHAVRAYGSTRHAKDLDVLIANTPENAARFVLAMAQLGVVHPNLRVDEIAGRKRQINFESWGLPFEVLTAAEGIEFSAAAARSSEAAVEHFVAPVISRSDLLVMKRIAGREIDKADVVFLEGAG